MEYVVQLENGEFLNAGDEWDTWYIFPTLRACEQAVGEYEVTWRIPKGEGGFNLFQIIQARWDNGQPL